MLSMHPGMFLLAITFNSLPRCVEKLNSCIFAVYILAIQSKCREYHWFMFSQVSCFFMPGKMSSETRQMLCAFKLCEKKRKPPNQWLGPSKSHKLPASIHIYSIKAPRHVSGVLQFIFLCLIKLGEAFWKNIPKIHLGVSKKKGFCMFNAIK